MNLTTYTASQARDRLYQLIKSAAKGLQSYEITLKGSDPVVMISKQELETWQETFDILANKEEAQAIKASQKDKSKISHQKLLQELGLEG